MRLIDANALLQELLKMQVLSVDSKDLFTGPARIAVFGRIGEQPTVDAVPVVRCKDCKYWDCGDCYLLELSRPDDYCSYGERREKEW